jgi:hypothetical protein
MDSRLANAQAIYAAYDPNGKLDPETGTYKPYTTAEQIKFNEAATMLNNAGISVGGGSQSQQSDADQSAQQASDWNNRYQNVLDDIANSNSDTERQQKVNYYEQNGELQQFRNSGLNPNNDIAYIGGAGQSDGGSDQSQQADNSGGVSPVTQNFQNALNDEINQNGPDAARQWINDNRDYLTSQNIDPDVALTWIP